MCSGVLLRRLKKCIKKVLNGFSNDVCCLLSNNAFSFQTCATYMQTQMHFHFLLSTLTVSIQRLSREPAEFNLMFYSLNLLVPSFISNMTITNTHKHYAIIFFLTELKIVVSEWFIFYYYFFIILLLLFIIIFDLYCGGWEILQQ